MDELPSFRRGWEQGTKVSAVAALGGYISSFRESNFPRRFLLLLIIVNASLGRLPRMKKQAEEKSGVKSSKVRTEASAAVRNLLQDRMMNINEARRKSLQSTLGGKKSCT